MMHDVAVDRSDRQTQAYEWAVEAFGHKHVNSLATRALRLLEEAIELYQVCGGDRDMAKKLTDYVFDRPAGEFAKELGGVCLTAMVLAEANDYSLEWCECREMERVLSRPVEYFTQRNTQKNEAGFVHD